MHALLVLVAAFAQDSSLLTRQLGSDDVAVREEATHALIELGEACLTAIEPARHSPDPEVAARAEHIRMEVFLCGLDADRLDLVRRREVRREVLVDPDGFESQAMTCAKEDVPYLLSLIREEGVDRRILATALRKLSLARLDDRERAQLVAILSPILPTSSLDGASTLSWRGVLLWIELDRHDALPWSETDRANIRAGWDRMATSWDAELRKRFATELSQAKNAAALEVLERMAADPSARVAMSAMLSMRNRHSPPSLDQWRGLFLRSKDDWGPRLRAAEGMAQCGEPEGLRYLFGVFEDGSPEEQGGATQLLLPLVGLPELDHYGGWGDPEADYRRSREQLLDWWSDHGETAQWDAEKGIYLEK
ncbi:MAG: HEAT repeat domain-containing protein [Planctomycetota bacterium]